MNSLTNKHILENGLTILTKEIHHAPLISHWIWYRVGSRNEIAGKTGVSHWVEHMQYKGTPKYPINVLDAAISKVGGYWNAMTYLDWTTYYETLPADKASIAIDLEADRMVNILTRNRYLAKCKTCVQFHATTYITIISSITLRGTLSSRLLETSILRI